MFDRIKKWYKQGLWTGQMVQDAFDKGVITKEQLNEILVKEE